MFGAGLTLTAIGATFGGNTFFVDEAVITLSAAQSVITLKPGAMLGHGDADALPYVAASGTTPAYSAILANFDSTTDVTLTPSAAGTLTFGASGEKSITQASANSGVIITLAGKATLVSGATYKVTSATTNVGQLALDTDAELELLDTVLVGLGLPAGADNIPAQAASVPSAKLVLAGDETDNCAVLKGAGKVVGDGIEITGGHANGTWTAGGATGTVTIEADSITGNDVASVAFTAGAQADAEIKVAASTLTVDKVAIVILTGTVGKVTLVGSTTAADVGKVLLKGGNNPGILKISTENTATVTSATAITLEPAASSDATDATVTGTIPGIIIKAGSATPTTPSVLGYISGGMTAGDNDAVIAGPSTDNNSVIISDWKVHAAEPNS